MSVHETIARYDSKKGELAESAYASAIASAQSGTLTAAVNSELEVGGRQTLWVRADNTTGSTTATLTVVLTRQVASGRKLMGFLERDITFGAQVPAASRVGAPLEAFDTAGATHAEIRITTLSGGAADLYAWFA